MSLQLRRGTDTDRQGIVFEEGEIVYVIDNKEVYVGDGQTAGGNLVSRISGTGVDSFNGRAGVVMPSADDYTSLLISYSNTSSSLVAITAQGAIDELDARLDTTESNISNLDASSHTHSNKAILDQIENSGSRNIITNAERNTLNSAIQPGNNISELTNDAGYLTSALQPGNNVSELINDAGYLTNIASENLEDLANVTITNPQDNQVLTYLGGQWSNIVTTGESNSGNNVGNGAGQLYRDKIGTTLNFKSIVAGQNVTIVNNDDDLVINATVSGSGGGLSDAFVFVNGETGGTIAASGPDTLGILGVSNVINTTVSGNNILISFEGGLNDLSDTLINSPTSGQVLYYDGISWSEKLLEISNINLLSTELANKINITDSINALNDVDTATLLPVNGQLLGWNGSNWVPTDSALEKADKVLGATSGNLAGLDLTGNLTDSGFSASDFATTAQGALADSALQTGDNISELTNDAGYITNGLQSGDNISELTNDAGYITNGLQSGDNISELTNDAGYITDGLQSGDNISELINDADYMQTGASILNDLLDVSSSSVVNGDILSYNGSQWVPVSPDTSGSVSSVFGRIGDVVAVDGDYSATELIYDPNSSNLTSIRVQGAIDELDTISGNLTTQIGNLQTDSHTHNNKAVIDLITDAGSGSIITNTERVLFSNAMQPGDNVSELVNDAGYLTTALQVGDNIGGLINDVGYLTTALQVGDNISGLINDAGYLLSGDDISLLNNNLGFITLSDIPADAVTSVFGRDGVVLPARGDYDLNDLSSVSPTLTPSLGHVLTYTGTFWESAAPTGGTGGAVDSVFGRTGIINAEAGDYSAFYATTAQGALADSALQSSDNISLLINDAGYLTTIPNTYLQTNDNVSDLTNDAGYITSDDVPVDSVFGRTGVVSAQNGDYDLSELGDVNSALAPANGQVLTFNGSNWNAATPSGGTGGGIEEAPNDGKQYGRQSEGWTEVVSGGSGGSTFESVRINYNNFGTIASVSEVSSGVTSTTIEGAQFIIFEFSYNRPPSSIIYYGYKDLGAPGWGYKMTQPSTSSLTNEVHTGGSSGNPAELLTNMSTGKIRLQIRTQETFTDLGEHAYVFFLF